MNRVCVLTTPRSGSQLCENIIRDHNHAIPLGEYFEAWNQNKFIIADGNLCLDSIGTKNSSFGIGEDYLERLDLLSQANHTQPVVLRLFLLEKYNKQELTTIVRGLNSINFKFICLQRKPLIDQLLSYIIAIHYRVYLKTSVFPINSDISTPVTIDIPFTRKVIGTMYPSILNFNKNVNDILGNIPKYDIEYSSIYEDLGRLYDTEFHKTGTKSIEGNPFDLIINKDEVTDLLKECNIQIKW